MAENYDYKAIESKWQKIWAEGNFFITQDGQGQKKSYVLDMFPYPSAQGLHVGHPEGYTATDIYCRYLRMTGINVLHPIGWDAFGLPAENYAVKTGQHPKKTTWASIDNFRRQIKSLGFSYDWSREINTADPAYYKWTQWLFLKLYEKGLAYQKEAPVNWCPSCQTVLANEQVVGGECERCHSQVEQKKMKQWFFKITAYADELLKELDSLDWPANIKEMQRNWIGKSEGAEVEFGIKNRELKIKIFTTRLDTIFGATYLVLAPEHPLLNELKQQIINWPEVEKYIKKTQSKTELERKVEAKEKTGVRLDGLMAINPANNEEIPIFIADYVLTSYGTGAIMAVPAHDERDWEFAQAFDQKIINVIKPVVESVCFNDYFFGVVSLAAIEGESSEDHNRRVLAAKLEAISKGKAGWSGPGLLVNSGEFSEMGSEEAKFKIAKKIGAKLTTQYRLRDWLISRQRYWGAPIPIIYCQDCGAIPVPVKDLPVELPEDVDFKPTGESPLVHSESFHNVKCPKCSQPARRESDTLDTFVDSSWYFLRYCDPHNDKEAFAAKKVAAWCPVDFYVGGAEHAVMHLLYARFFIKVLADLDYVKFREPFLKLRNQGLILGEDGQKMSKSRGNVVNPDEVVEKFGADTFRLYEMFMGPFAEAKPWNTSSIIGLKRFLEKVWRLVLTNDKNNKTNSTELDFATANVIKKVTQDIIDFNFNTAISSLMEYVNIIQTGGQGNSDNLKVLLLLLYPLAPHITSELWNQAGYGEYIWENAWPQFKEQHLFKKEVAITVQINGKLRDVITMPIDLEEAEAVDLAKKSDKVNKNLAGSIKKIIYLKNKLINFVVDS